MMKNIRMMVKVALLAFTVLGCSMSFANEVDLKKYDHIQDESVRFAKFGIDYFKIGQFEDAEEYFKKAITSALEANAPPEYINNLKTKLATTYVNLEQYEKGRALLKEVHGVDTLK